MAKVFQKRCAKVAEKSGLVRVFSQNCHLRPTTTTMLSLVRSLPGRLLPEGFDPTCGDVNMDDVQMKRACQIVTSIQRMIGTTSEADIVCLQEAFEKHRQKRIIRGLRRFYPYSHSSYPDEAGSLTMSKYPIVYEEFVPFSRAVGADLFMKKGMLVTLHEVQKNRRYMLVFNIHPSPYVSVLGATHHDVYSAHMSQLKEISAKSKEVLTAMRRKYMDSRIILVFAGDFNINRYASVPDAEEEHDPDKADMCCSNEFMQTEYILKATQPPLTIDPTPQNWYEGSSNVARFTRDLLDKRIPIPIAGHGGVYSWDGTENTVAVNPLWPNPSYQLIDFVMVSNKGTIPAYSDNRIVRLPTQDIIPWVRRPQTRKYCGWPKNVEQQRIQRIKNMRKGIKWRRGRDGQVDLKRYGSDTCGVNPRELSVDEFKKWRKEQERGFFDFDFEETKDYLPYQMYNNVSDHYGVMAYIIFPGSEAAEYVRSTRLVPPPVYSLNAMKNEELALGGSGEAELRKSVWKNMRSSIQRVRDPITEFYPPSGSEPKVKAPSIRLGRGAAWERRGKGKWGYVQKKRRVGGGGSRRGRRPPWDDTAARLRALHHVENYKG